MSLGYPNEILRVALTIMLFFQPILFFYAHESHLLCF